MTRSCPNCTSIVLADASSCSYCGNQFKDAPVSAEDLVAAPPPGALPPETKTCPECAEEIKYAAKVCRYCGHAFDSATRLAVRGILSSPEQPDRRSTTGALTRSGSPTGLWIGIVIFVLLVLVTARACAPEQLSERCLTWREDVLAQWELFKDADVDISFDFIVQDMESSRPPQCPTPSP